MSSSSLADSKGHTKDGIGAQFGCVQIFNWLMLMQLFHSFAIITFTKNILVILRINISLAGIIHIYVAVNFYFQLNFVFNL